MIGGPCSRPGGTPPCNEVLGFTILSNNSYGRSIVIGEAPDFCIRKNRRQLNGCPAPVDSLDQVGNRLTFFGTGHPDFRRKVTREKTLECLRPVAWVFDLTFCDEECTFLFLSVLDCLSGMWIGNTRTICSLPGLPALPRNPQAGYERSRPNVQKISC